MTYKLPEGRKIRVLFHACAVQKPILSLGCLGQQEYWSDLRVDSGTLFSPDKTQTKRSQTQLPKEESLFFVKGMLVAPLSTAGVSDEVAQELQMPMGPHMLEDVEEPMLARPATLRDPGNRDGTAQSDTLSESALVQDVRRNFLQLCLNFTLTTGTWVKSLCRRSRLICQGIPDLARECSF